MRVERSDGGIEADRVHVIEQQAHAHPSLCRLPECLKHEVADMVAIPDEVLRVERLLRGGGEQDARGEGIPGIGHRTNPGLGRMRSDTGRDRAAEPCVRRVGERGGLDPIERRWQRRAARSDDRRRDQKKGQHPVHLGGLTACRARKISLRTRQQRARAEAPPEPAATCVSGRRPRRCAHAS